MASVLEPPEEDSETAVIQHKAYRVAFLVSDNCSLNKRLAQDQSWPALTLSQPASKFSLTNRTL
ncbi:hypothetical protein PPTG_24339 [Phytophthora nicotianae INRA-310]|uniref:Uncharacterized protein n=1 Tax=Phytophthora nicotianae (strain INRA-310) TaxID=761204 RepID=W2PGL2_PHYN3|nr:hypothetical protein PPTG_24339 [Phytophthora nicotianae INRA-310]ETN00022.1 hypothetical protein PPTG_24339 [Phytophthora nicotianae INRA-310]